MVNFCDPLVINLNSNVAEVSDQKFFFDLDADGEEEGISRLYEDSGYLALDLNGNGRDFTAFGFDGEWAGITGSPQVLDKLHYIRKH